MNTTQNNPQPIKEVLDKATDILVLLGQNPSPDVIASGLALHESLLTMNKSVLIASPSQIDTSKVDLPRVNEITNKIGNRNLVISLKVESRESIDKVSYNLDESSKVFNLVISPKKGSSPLKSNDIEYSYAGVQADVVFIIGANRLEDLGYFYQNEQKLFTESTTVCISNNPMVKYGMHNYVDSSSGTISELMLVFLKEIGVKISANMAEDLLFGVDISTKYLQSPRVTANTFEAIAELMRAGGKRKQIPQVASNGNGVPNGRNSQLPKSQGAQSGKVPDEWLNPKIYSGSQAQTRKN